MDQIRVNTGHLPLPRPDLLARVVVRRVNLPQRAAPGRVAHELVLARALTAWVPRRVGEDPNLPRGEARHGVEVDGGLGPVDHHVGSRRRDKLQVGTLVVERGPPGVNLRPSDDRVVGLLRVDRFGDEVVEVVRDCLLRHLGEADEIHAGDVAVPHAVVPQAARQPLLENGKLRVQWLVHAGHLAVGVHAFRLDIDQCLVEGPAGARVAGPTGPADRAHITPSIHGDVRK